MTVMSPSTPRGAPLTKVPVQPAMEVEHEVVPAVNSALGTVNALIWPLIWPI